MNGLVGILPGNVVTEIALLNGASIYVFGDRATIVNQFELAPNKLIHFTVLNVMPDRSLSYSPIDVAASQIVWIGTEQPVAQPKPPADLGKKAHDPQPDNGKVHVGSKGMK